MRRTLLFLPFLAFIVTTHYLPLTNSVFAQAQNPPNTLSQNALSISPFIFEESLEKGQTKTYQIQVRNLSNTPLPITLSINDFIPVDNEGHVRFLQEGEVNADRYSLSTWITITKQPEFVLPPLGKTALEFQISVPIQAEAGTHYGGLLFGFEDSIQNITGTKVKQKLGALVIATIGKAIEKGEITQFSVSPSVKNPNILEFSTIIKNTSNTRIIPKGEVEIRNWYGKLIGISYINKDGSLILPNSERNFVTTIAKPNFFGYYRAEAWVQYGNPPAELRKRINFWIYSKTTLVNLSIGLLILIPFLIIGLKRYNRWIISKAKLTHI